MVCARDGVSVTMRDPTTGLIVHHQDVAFKVIREATEEEWLADSASDLRPLFNRFYEVQVD